MREMPANPNLNCLIELANRDGVDIRPTLLRVTTDLYVQEPIHTAEEDRHFTELALGLFDLVDARTRKIVAERIAAYPNAPDAVRRRILRYHAGQGEQPADARPAPDPFAGSKAAAEELTELFFTASPEERRLILANLSDAPLAPAPPVAPALAREVVDRLEVAALGHNRESFARDLHRALAISLPLARRVLDDPWGEPIVVAAVALGMPPFVLQRVLLCLNASISQSVQRVYDLALLHEELAPEAALRLLAIWQADRDTIDRKVPAPTARENDRGPAVPAHPPENVAARRLPSLSRPKILWHDHAESRKESA
jgi:hypothetical protein